MKKVSFPRFLSAFLALAMIWGLVPFGALTAFAIQNAKDVVLTVDEELLPQAGRTAKFTTNLFSVSKGRPYHVMQISNWTDDVVQPKSYDVENDRWYNVTFDGVNPAGVAFEAGRTYHVTVTLEINADMRGAYRFDDDEIESVTISNLSKSAYSVVRYRDYYNGADSSNKLDIVFAFKAPGERTYDDIEKGFLL